MLKGLLAIAFVMMAFPAQSETANDKAKREADTFLLGCRSTDANELSLCRMETDRFRSEYIKAKAGDYTAQRNVSFVLARGESGSGARIAVPNRTQACAWVLTMFAGGSPEVDEGDRSLIQTRCGALDQSGQALARSRAAALLNEIRTTPTRPPPPPSFRATKGPLDGTACPLPGGPDARKFPGCP